MAATAQQQVELARGYQRQQQALRAATTRDALRLWSVLDFGSLKVSYPRWQAAVRLLVQRDSDTATALAAAYVQEAKRLTEGLTATIVPADSVNLKALGTSLRVTSVVAYARARGAGMTDEAANRAALVQSLGTTSRFVLDQGRQTAIRSTFASKGGWQRVPSSAACAFCRMLANRGAVYSESSADFAAHDHCSCTAVSVFGERRTITEFVPSVRHISDADRTRVRAWMQAHPDAA